MLNIAFDYAGMQCCEPIGLPATPANILVAERLAEGLATRITDGTFSYSMTFPDSQLATLLPLIDPTHGTGGHLQFSVYARQWHAEREKVWREPYAKAVKVALEQYLIPEFGHLNVDAIQKSAILSFRSALLGRPNRRNGSALGPNRVNQIMNPLRAIIVEAAGRFNHRCVWRDIKPLREPSRKPDPLSLREVDRFLDGVRPDFANYYEFRFFTGLRGCEIHGLDWDAIDFDNHVAQIRQAYVNCVIVPCKNAGSHRIVALSDRAIGALKRHKTERGVASGPVFLGPHGKRLDNAWISRAIWYPTLAKVGLSRRLPHSSRHTIATLWLAAGESPQWIARQLGHADTEMLFKVYGRYVPNAVQVDGAAFDAYLDAASARYRASTLTERPKPEPSRSAHPARDGSRRGAD